MALEIPEGKRLLAIVGCVGCLIYIGMLGCAFINNYFSADQPKKDVVMMKHTDQNEVFSLPEGIKAPVIARSRETGIPIPLEFAPIPTLTLTVAAPPTAETVEFRLAAPGTFAPQPPAADQLAQDFFGNAARNGRVGRAAPRDALRFTLVLPLPEASRPARHVLAAGDGLLTADEGGAWILWSAGGEELARGPASAAKPWVRGERGLLFAITGANALGAFALATGELAWSLPLGQSASYSRVYGTSCGKSFFVVSEASQRRGSHRAAGGLVQLFSVPEKLTLNDDGDPLGWSMPAEWARPSGRLLGGYDDSHLLLADRNSLWWLDPAGQFTHHLRGDFFAPLVFSAHGDGTVALLCLGETADVSKLVWLGPRGLLGEPARIEGALPLMLTPPVISHEGRIAVVLRRSIVFFDSAAKQTGRFEATEEIGGVAAAADGDFIASVGCEFLVLSPSGRSRVAGRCSEPLLSAPTPARAPGTWWVLTRSGVQLGTATPGLPATNATVPDPSLRAQLMNNESFLDSIKQAAQFSIWGGRIRTDSARLHRLIVPPAKGFGRWQITSQSRPPGGEPARDWQIWNLAEGSSGDELFVVNLHEYDSVLAAHLALLERLASITAANVDFTPAVSGPGDVLILDYMARDNLVVHLVSVRPVDKATRLELLRSIDDWLLQN